LTGRDYDDKTTVQEFLESRGLSLAWEIYKFAKEHYYDKTIILNKDARDIRDLVDELVKTKNLSTRQMNYLIALVNHIKEVMRLEKTNDFKDVTVWETGK
jgi:hypothetical protein